MNVDAYKPSPSELVAIEELRFGRPIIVRYEAAPMLIMGAQTLTVSQLHFAIRYSTGLVFALLRSRRLDYLRIPDQPTLVSESSGLPIAVAVDANVGTTTGISAIDRTTTLRVLADPATVADDLTRPGHVPTLRCRDDADSNTDMGAYILNLLERAGVEPVAALCHLADDGGELLDASMLELFARDHAISCVTAPVKTERECPVYGGLPFSNGE